jgi:hypothetical protein
MMSALLLLLAALAGSNAVLAFPCDQLFSASSGKLSLSGGNCSALILPDRFYAAPAPSGALEAPGGVAVAMVSSPAFAWAVMGKQSPPNHICCSSSMSQAQQPLGRLPS